LSVPIIANRDLCMAMFIANIIKDLGHELVSSWVVSADPGFTLTPTKVLDRDINGVKDSDVIVAETSVPSHGVGMEIMLAHLKKKTIVCLYRKGTPISRMILGIPGAYLIEYTRDQDLLESLKETLMRINTDEAYFADK
jgi:2'-deoxynucleoside 5'-phosphate N-hydrolase